MKQMQKFIGVCVLAALIFGIRYYQFVQFRGDEILEEQVGQKIEAEGIVVSEPDERETSVRFVVKLLQLKNAGKVQDLVPTKIIVGDQPYSEVQYGDRVTVAGILLVPENFENDNGREFDYVNYLTKDRIFYEIKRAGVEVLESRQGNPVKHVLFRIKHSFIGNLEQVLSFPESQLAGGLVVAGKKSLPKEIQDEFQKTGTLQIVVLSGYNVTIVADMIMGVSKTLSFTWSAGLGIFGIMLFVVMAGGSATIVRGGVMAILVILAKNARRRYNVTRALFVTGYCMLLYNPMMLFHDPSFQLSFLATAGLIYISPIIEKRLSFITERFKLREITASTLAAQIAVLPLLMYTMGEVSIVSLPANILVSLAVPLTMLICFITGILGYISVFLAYPVSLLAFLLLRYILQTIHILAHIPYASLSIPYFPLILVTLVYMSYIVFIWKFYRREEVKVSL